MKKQAMIWMGACVLGMGLSGCLKTPEVKEYQPHPLPLEKRVKREKLALKETKKAPVVKKKGLAGFALSTKKAPKSYTEKRVGEWIQSHVPGGYTRPGRMVRRRRVAASRGGRVRYRYKRRPMPRSVAMAPSRPTTVDAMPAPPRPTSRVKVSRRASKRSASAYIARRRRVVRRALRASSRDDNKFFDHYLLYHRKHASLLPVSYRMDISERYAFQVTDRKGRGLPNCRVTISGDDRILWHGRTDARGHMLFFPRVTTASVGVKTFYASFLFGGKTLVRAFKRARYGSDRPWKVKMDVEKATNQPRVEVLFLLDTTGSMSDEIARIQQTLLAITAKVKRQTPGAELRFGMVLYRDRTDAYVTRRYPFTGDIKQFNRALQQVRAAGGGDTPEAMNMGLYAGIEQMKWSPSALRLVFLVADAPPHLDYGNDVPYTKTLRSAVAKGIKIYPVAASGLDKRGTYIYRQIAQFTQAKFLFIEYGSGTAARHGISGPTSSNNLDDIVLRIVKTELKHYMN